MQIKLKKFASSQADGDPRMGKGDGRASIAETAETPVARVAQRDRRTSLRSRVGGRCHGTRRFTKHHLQVRPSRDQRRRRGTRTALAKHWMLSGLLLGLGFVALLVSVQNFRK